MMRGNVVKKFNSKMKLFSREGIIPMYYNDYSKMSKFMTYNFDKTIIIPEVVD